MIVKHYAPLSDMLSGTHPWKIEKNMAADRSLHI